MLRSAPRLRRGALLIRGPSSMRRSGSRLCGAARRALHRVRDTIQAGWLPHAQPHPRATRWREPGR